MSTTNPTPSAATTAATAVTEVKATADSILTIISAADPGVALEAGTAQVVVDLLATLASQALTAYGAAAGVTINATTVAALMPNAAPLSAPDAPTS